MFTGMISIVLGISSFRAGISPPFLSGLILGCGLIVVIWTGIDMWRFRPGAEGETGVDSKESGSGRGWP